jgi:hypothetical protein
MRCRMWALLCTVFDTSQRIVERTIRNYSVWALQTLGSSPTVHLLVRRFCKRSNLRLFGGKNLIATFRNYHVRSILRCQLGLECLLLSIVKYALYRKRCYGSGSGSCSWPIKTECKLEAEGNFWNNFYLIYLLMILINIHRFYSV